MMTARNSSRLNRRALLRGSGAALALPLLEAMGTDGARAALAAPKRLVCICASLGLHGPDFFPQQAGTSYTPTPYLDLLREHRNEFTVLSGLSHPDQSGSDGHSSEASWLTSARHPGLGGFRNTISIDQLVAQKIGVETRFPSLTLGTSGTSQSYTLSGVMIPAETRPSQVFARLFLEGSAGEVTAQLRKLQEGRSILDTVGAEARRLSGTLGAADRARLDEYLASVRESEQRLARAMEWSRKPKPKVEAAPPQDVSNESDLIARMRLLFDLIPLALQTDSTRIITVLIQGRNDVPPVPGVNIDHHNLSHHGQDPAKIQQLRLIETAELRALNELLTALKRKKEPTGSLLDQTQLLFGSNLGNANSHDPRNLPLLLAGGGFKHAGHLAFDAHRNLPFANLLAQLGNRMGLELPLFGTGSGATVPGLA